MRKLQLKRVVLILITITTLLLLHSPSVLANGYKEQGLLHSRKFDIYNESGQKIGVTFRNNFNRRITNVYDMAH